jgi:hypothetical protein
MLMADVYFPHFGALGAVTAGTVIHNTVGARTYRLRTGSGGRGKTNLSKRRAGIREKILYMNEEGTTLDQPTRHETKSTNTDTKGEKSSSETENEKTRHIYCSLCGSQKKRQKFFLVDE